MATAAGVRFGRYQLLEKIGAGGMGEVYRALDLVLGRHVAVKLLPEAFASHPRRLASFVREARTASSLNHPNILTVHDVGQARGRQFIVTELIDGRTLRQLLGTQCRLPVRQVLELGIQMAEGLARAHAAGIVHRDLKPDNVMVNADRRVKVLDFGIAKLQYRSTGEASHVDTSDLPTWPGDLERGLSVGEGPLVGTLGYISPEQARGQPVDHRSDQFALGAILYEMATGRRAFHGENPAATVSAILDEEPASLARLRPDLPAPVRWVIERCLAKDPAERYASTDDLSQALRGLRAHLSELTSEPARAAARSSWRPPPPPSGRVWRLAFLAVALALVGMGLVHSEPWVRSLWSNGSGLTDGRAPAGEEPPLERMDLRWTLGPPAEGGSVVVEGRVERWDDEVRITTRLVGGADARPPEARSRLDAEVLTLATALAEILGATDGKTSSPRGPVSPTGEPTRRPHPPSLTGDRELEWSP